MKLLAVLYDWASSIVIALIIAILISIFVIQPSSVFGSSMEPTLNEGDWVIISRIQSTLKMDYDYLEIVIIDSNVEKTHTIKDDLKFIIKHNGLSKRLLDQEPEDKYWIKRVIGKEGDLIEFKGGKVYRNGTLLEEPYIQGDVTYATFEAIKVPENHVFVLGDNRRNSADSRSIGTVPVDNVLGKMIFNF